MMSDVLLVCNMSVFTPDQREKHVRNTIWLVQGVQAIQELEHGYQFALPDRSEYISRIADFISDERLCCPFLEFNLDVGPARQFISLSLTGPAGTKEFLRDEFNGAFQ